VQLEAKDDVMSRFHQIFFVLCLLLGAHSLTYAQGKQSEARGELLYMEHCNACHTAQVHWREQKLSTDWSSLVAQVRRWQGVSGLLWNEEEIKDVANYLNAVFYKYKNTAQINHPDKLLFRN
jgi:mono/diheme cytochrome c family protein